ncbi:MAG: 1-acyl-sn-glycerol-3-phosphate acyltransferase [Candidatus Omnitrophica bacterium]|jgi:1-acyl-sn-glycerol-3-phosphate acyltransferase|nr:1-acyl-sn-glycerol-3-phosphate acyltransferase [Candidatus Omnitrophota bacterium]
MLYRISTSLVFCLLKLFFKFEVEGREAIPRKQPFILASNHVSNLDPPTLATACPVKIGFIAKEELFKSRLFSIYLRDVGAIPLKREKSDIKALRTCLKILKNKPLLIFPQGTRGSNFDELNFGVGFLSRKAAVPIIAARIYGTDEVLPKGAKGLSFGKIKVIFAKVDNIKEEDSYQDITLKVADKIRSL